MRFRALGLALALGLAASPSVGSAGAGEAGAPPSVQGSVEADAQPGGSPTDDPWQPVNRRIFAFNEGVDRWFLEPVATGWDWTVPERVQRCVSNFFDHLLLPVRFANEVLQVKPRRAYEIAWRAVINTTVGLGGLFDPATTWTVYRSDEDFGQTLGYWGTPPGPYMVLPFLGPSNPRDTLGLIVDRFGYVPSYFVPFYVTAPAASVDIVNDRAAALETVRAERESAFDFYSAVRGAYRQYRENQIRDREEAPEADADEEDLYYFDDEEDFDEL